MKPSISQEDYTQLCVWPGTYLGDTSIEDFENYFKEQHGVRVKFAEETVTLPDVDDGKVVEGTGGRQDILFFVHSEDIPKFAVIKLQMGVRWWEDIVSYNNHANWYKQEILDKYPVRW